MPADSAQRLRSSLCRKQQTHDNTVSHTIGNAVDRTDSDTDPGGWSNPGGLAHADADADRYARSHSGSHADSHSGSYTDSHSGGHTDSHPGSHTFRHAHTHPICSG